MSPDQLVDAVAHVPPSAPERTRMLVVSLALAVDTTVSRDWVLGLCWRLLHEERAR